MPIPIKSVDGKTIIVGIGRGFVINSPAVAAITHVLNNKVDFASVNGVDDILVSSMGAGAIDCP